MSGRINVLRSSNPEDLSRYHHALRGESVDARFVILLDGKTYDPSQQWIVGANRVRATDENETVAQYLDRHGRPIAVLESLLLTLGLGGLSLVQLSELTPVQLKGVRLIAALGMECSTIVVDEPFEGVSPSSREAFAQFLVDSVRDSERMIIITGLSYRPEAWIEHELVSRVLLERPRQPTIGMGGASYQGGDGKIAHAELIRMRTDLMGGGGHSGAHKRIYAAVTTALLLGVCGTVMYGMREGPRVAIPDNVPVSIASSSSRDSRVAMRNDTSEFASTVERTSEQPTPPPQSARALRQLPTEIREIVMQAYSDPDGITKARSARPIPQIAVRKSFIIPAETNVAPPAAVHSDYGTPADSAEIERRREEIRQRFLDALSSNQ